MPHRIFIETPRLLLREWLPQDEAPFIALNSDKEVMEFFPATFNAEETRHHIKRISTQINEKGYGWFAVERKDSHAFIGFTGLSHPGFESTFTPCTEIGWRLAKEHWGNGFATEAAKACLQFGFEQLGLDTIYSFTAIPNTRSENVMKKIGMQKAGTFLHPKLEEGHFLQEHVLYKISRHQ
jgi:RimJ/RimL family protein N-acetyltransferase